MGSISFLALADWGVGEAERVGELVDLLPFPPFPPLLLFPDLDCSPEEINIMNRRGMLVIGEYKTQ